MDDSSLTRDGGSEASVELTGQRRQVTVLFADMADYMPLAEKLGEENTYLFMQRVHRELSEAIHGEEGTVQDMTGDGVMALFGAPVALEDAPLRACRAALDIQARMARLGGEIEAEYGARPAFRVGLHSGPLIFGAVGDDQQMELTAMGDTVNLASRLESSAESGTVLMSEAAHALVAGYVDCQFEGEREIKGRREPEKVWRLVAVKQGIRRFDIARARGLTPLVGRQQELDTLERLWREAERGQIRLVNISGEAGIGKSRLVHEFRARLDKDAFVLEGYCAAEGQAVPLLPFADIVRRSFGLTPQSGRDEAEGRLRRGLILLGLDAEEHLPYLLILLGYDDGARANVADEARGIRTRDAVVSMLYERCKLNPTVMIFEDLHWMDNGSEALLIRALKSDEALPVLIITTHRPEYTPPWSGRSGSTDMVLEPLSRSGTVDLLKARFDVAELPENFTRLVDEKAEGNPLFAEEVSNYLLEAGTLQSDGGSLRFASAGQAMALPAGLENMLMDRFDRLATEPRNVLEAAAVLGQRFEVKTLAAMTGSEAELTGHLAVLEDQELILREPGHDAYRFKHALVHDAVYDSMLKSRRRVLHEKAGAAIEAAKGPEAADALAHHWSHTERPDKAIRYLALAGENSLRVYALEEGDQRLQAALTMAEAHPDALDDNLLTDILLHIARSNYFQFKFDAIIGLVQTYLHRVEALGDKTRLSRFLFEGGYAMVFACRVKEGRALLDRARAIGEDIGDELAVAYADMGAMWDRMFWGAPGPERRRAQSSAGKRIMAIGQKHGDIWLASKAGLALALDHAGYGRPGECREVLSELMAMSRRSNDPRPRTMALYTYGVIDVYSGNYEEAIEYADEALRVCLSPIDIAAAELYRAIAAVMAGRAADNLPTVYEYLSRFEDRGFRIFHPLPRMVGGVGSVLLGKMAWGMKEIGAATAQSEAWDMKVYGAFGDLYAGETYLQMMLGGEKPSLSVMLRNLPFLLSTLPAIKRKTRRRLQSALEQFRYLDCPSLIAQCLYALGRLDMAEKRPDDARGKFQEARELAASVDAFNIVTDADTAMAGLRPN